MSSEAIGLPGTVGRHRMVAEAAGMQRRLIGESAGGLHTMATDYRRISDENARKYGTDLWYDQLLRDLYSDRTHFVYELLQNAEDADASWVEFCLYQDRLEIRHDGRAFDEADVQRICALGQTAKRDDLTKIGKFGIGFKSVYAYALSPEVHCGHEHFRIERYVHPTGVEGPPNLTQEETLFVLPFDQPQVAAARSFEEIARRLGTIGHRTLLFLRKIQKVTWRIEGRAGGRHKQKEVARGTARRVALEYRTDSAEQSETWLVFDRAVTACEALLRVEVAFRVELDEKSGRESIVPSKDSPLVVFFPTEKETHLRFLAQGPYRTTPARDNIPHDDEWNRRLVGETATLGAQALPMIRDMGLLTVTCLETLPIRADEFPPDSMFRPVFEAVRNALRQEPLLPTCGGGFAAASAVKLARSAALRDLMSEEQLQALWGSDRPIAWLSADITQDRTPELWAYLLEELEVEEVAPEDFARRLDSDFMSKQPDEWVARFYRFLQDQSALWREGSSWQPRGVLRDKPIIRLQTGEHVSPFRDDGSPSGYLPTGEETDFPVVKPEVCRETEARTFLANLGLRSPDAVADVVEHVLPKYQTPDGGAVSDAEHEKHLERIVRALGTDSSSERRDLIERLRDTAFLKSVNAGTGEKSFESPQTAYRRTPELEVYLEGNGEAWFVDEALGHLPADDFEQLLSSLGVEDKPRRAAVVGDLSWEEKQALLGNDGCTYERGIHDYDLDGLEPFLNRLKDRSPSEVSHLPRILWQFLIAYAEALKPWERDGFFSGTYEYFYRTDKSKHFDARFLKKLRDTAWLPGPDGSLARPEQRFLADLPDDLAKDEFIAGRLGMKPPALKNLASAAGLPLRVIEYLRDNPEVLRELERRAQETLQEQTAPPAEEKVKPAESPVEEPPRKVTRQEVAALPPAEPPPEKRHEERLRTYVAPARPADATDREHREVQRREDLEEAAINRVVEHERRGGRSPKVMPANHPGCDIESRNPDGEVLRYIEVKAVSGEWGSLGAEVTRTQFERAGELGERYWLYVVERAQQDDFTISRIQNPARQVNRFVYDDGWRALAEETDSSPTQDSTAHGET